MNRKSLLRLRTAGLGLCTCGLLISGWTGMSVVLADSSGAVFVDNAGSATPNGNGTDPHLDCADVAVYGSGLSLSSSSLEIDGLAPTGSGEAVYTAPWTYALAGSDPQVIATVAVSTLVADAENAGDTAQAKHGFHFKLELSQDASKSVTFWVDCPGSTGGSTGGGTTTTTSSSTTSSDSSSDSSSQTSSSTSTDSSSSSSSASSSSTSSDTSTQQSTGAGTSTTTDSTTSSSAAGSTSSDSSSSDSSTTTDASTLAQISTASSSSSSSDPASAGSSGAGVTGVSGQSNGGPTIGSTGGSGSGGSSTTSNGPSNQGAGATTTTTTAGATGTTTSIDPGDPGSTPILPNAASIPTPMTGADIPFGLGLLLIIGGGSSIAISERLRRRRGQA